MRTSKTVEQNALREAEPQLFGANPVQVAANGNAGTPPASVQAGRSIPLPRPAPRPKEVHYPVGGEERNDRVGSGWYNAPRGRRTHDGVDITANPGEPVVAPIDGEVVRRGFVYSANTAGNNPHLRNMQSVHIEGSGKYKGMKTVLYYVDGTGPAVHEKVKAGTTILGLVQDVPGAYAKDPDPNRVKRNAGMKPHVHLEVIWQGKKIDPAGVLPLWKSAGGIGSP